LSWSAGNAIPPFECCLQPLRNIPGRFATFRSRFTIARADHPSMTTFINRLVALLLVFFAIGGSKLAAQTGDVPMTAAAMRLRVKGIRFMMRDLLSE